MVTKKYFGIFFLEFVIVMAIPFYSYAQSYTTTFDLSENPISEGGRWINNTGTFTSVRTIGGSAFGTHGGLNYDDSIAHLSGFSPNQYIEGTVYKSGTFSANQEIELLLRMSTSRDFVRGYEILINYGGGCQIMRWNGSMTGGFFTDIGTANIGSIANGDVIKAQMIGNTITVFKNGVVVGTANDSVVTSGNPGVGFFTRDTSGEQNLRFGWTQIKAGVTDGVTQPKLMPPANLRVK
jgi:hypothetical protein